VKNQSYEIIPFKVRKATELKKLFDAYSQHANLPVNSLKFFLDGLRITDSETPQ
jgi:hypothetical protein